MGFSFLALASILDYLARRGYPSDRSLLARSGSSQLDYYDVMGSGFI